MIIDTGETLRPVEIKSGATVASDWFTNLDKWTELAGNTAALPMLVYGGEQTQERSKGVVLPWHGIDSLPPVNSVSGGH